MHRKLRSRLFTTGSVLSSCWLLCATALLPPQAAAVAFDVALDGALVVPVPVLTDATGQARVRYDPATQRLSVEATLDGILVADLFPKIQDSPFHLHLADPQSNGPIALAFGSVDDWEPLIVNGSEFGITLSFSVA